MDVALLLVGDEILSGHTRDANGPYLSARLHQLGHRLVALRVAPDVDAAVARDLHQLLEVAPVLLVTGGLGPTHDDRTTEAVADALGLALMVDEAAMAHLLRRYGGRYGGAPPEHVLAAGRKMCTVPKGATTLANPVGAAVGYAIPRPPGFVAVLPGVPAEMQAMFEQEVVKRILPAATAEHVEEVALRLPEADIAATLARLARENPEVAIGSYPRPATETVTVRLRGRREDTLRLRHAIEAAFKESVVIRAADGETG